MPCKAYFGVGANMNIIKRVESGELRVKIRVESEEWS